ncbi:MAG: hypothetical protein JNK25_08625 [Phycisphaerae bacterium]|nr:hypothetical protein [Phycisphaerae bacterium]
MNVRVITKTIGRLLACIGVSVWLLAVHPSQAQFGMGMGGMDSMMQDTITKRGLDAYAKLLGLDKEQKETAMTLLEGNQTATRAAMKEFQSKMEALAEKARDEGFGVYQKDMPAISREMATKFEGLEKGFFDDLKSILTPDQVEKWPSVERYRRREQAMRFGFVSGAAVDLIAVVERTGTRPAGNTEFDETLERYELDVDRMLQNFERQAKDAQKDVLEGGAMFDMQKIQGMMKSMYEGAKEVRDTNRVYARQLAGLMPEEGRAKFEAEVQRRSFPRVYRPSHTTKSLDAALKFADLTPEQKESVSALRESYQRDLAPINTRWARATEEKEDKSGGSMMVMMEGFMGGAGPDDPVKQARDARKDLDDKALAKLSDILTPAQKSRLPEKKSAPMNPMADFMPDLDEEEQTDQ